MVISCWLRRKLSCDKLDIFTLIFWKIKIACLHDKKFSSLKNPDISGGNNYNK